MPTSRKNQKEELFGDIKTNILIAAPEPETDIHVKRGLTWAIGGTITGAIFAISWFVYRLFAPLEGVNEAAEGAADYIVVPVLGILYGLIGAVVGGCIGISIGIIYMGIAALKEARDSEEEEEEEEQLPRITNRTIRGHY